MRSDKVRRAIISDWEEIKDIMLSQKQVSLVKYIIRMHSVSSRRISVARDISIQNASMQLNKLFVKGYLSREKVVDESGGIIFLYEVRV